jgi:hypothetical protein
MLSIQLFKKINQYSSIDEIKNEILEYSYEEILKEFALNKIPKIKITIIDLDNKQKQIHLDFYDDLLEKYDLGEVLNDYKEMYANCLKKCE